MKQTIRAALVAATALGLPGLAHAQADMRGKTVEWVVPFAAGGGSDVWARFFQPYLSHNLPGQPVVVIKNVPGGGSITGTNQFAERARPDGLTILATSGSTQFPYLLGDPRAKYDYKVWTPVLVSPTGGVVYINPGMGVKTPADLKKLGNREMKYGSQGPTSLDLVPALAFDLLGLNVKIVFGMRGRADGRIAFERGEMELDYQTSTAYIKQVVPLVKEGKAVPLFSWGSINDKGEIVRDPTFPDLPNFEEAYQAVHGKAPSGIEYEAFKAMNAAGFGAQKTLVLPKGTPEPVVEAYRQAIAKTVADPKFKTEAAEELGDYKQAVGPDAEKLYAVATTISPAARDWLRDWLVRKYNTRL